MPPFSPAYAAFEGLRVTRERPWAVATWALLLLALGLVSALIRSGISLTDMALLEAIRKGANVPMADQVALMRRLAPPMSLLMALGLALSVVLTCAVFRAVLKPADRAWAYLKVGRDEGRMLLLMLALSGLALGAVFVLTLLDEMLTAASAPAIRPAVFAAGFVAMLWVGVRLSLAAPMSFITGELHVFRAWPLSRGKSVALLGAYALAALLAFVVMMLAMVIYAAGVELAFTLIGGHFIDLERILTPEVHSLSDFLKPEVWLSQVFGAGVNAVFYVNIAAPAAVAYAALAQTKPAQSKPF